MLDFSLLKYSLNKTVPLLLLLALPASAGLTRVQYVMGTACEITAEGPAAAKGISAAFAEIARWDRVLSLYKKESEASRMNREAAAGPFACSESLWEAVTASLEYQRKSGGAFDASLGSGRVQVDTARRAIRFLKAGMSLDFGGIGKGLALDHAAHALRQAGVRSAFLNFGGQIYALGDAPGRSGWPVRLEDGRELTLRDASTSTSGNSEQPGHIVSPLTGKKVLTGAPVTVVAPSAAEADAWSTALFVRGSPDSYAGCALSGKAVPAACAPYKPSYKGEHP